LPSMAAPSTSKHPRAWPFAMLVAVGVGGGLMVSLIRLATTGGVPFIPFAFWNAAFGAAVLVPIAFARRTPPRLKLGHLRFYAILGALGIALPMCIFAYVAPKLPAAIVAVTQTLIPIITYALALAVGAERFRWLSAMGIALGFAGVLFIVVPGGSLPEPAMASWVLVLLLTAFSLALAFIAAARFRPSETASLSVAAGTLSVGALFLLPVMAIEGSWWLLDSGLDEGAMSLLAMAALNALLLVFFYEIVRLAGPVFCSTNNYVVPIAGVAWGMLIFGDSLSDWVWAALALMIAGLALMNAREVRVALAGGP
jgi:drug/metabolite transporter (DMT)-like permease